MQLSEKIKTLRKRKGISQQELADRIGIHITHVSRLENGHYQLSFDVLKKLVSIFEVCADYLMTEDEDDFEVKIKDKMLADKIRLIDSLEDNDRQALIQVIDSMLTKKEMLELLTKKEVTA